MNKKQFITLLVGVVSGLLFSIGMCMCLLPEWNAFVPGVVLTIIGGVALMVMGITAYIRTAYNRRPINWVFVGKIAYSVVSALVLGLGMTCILVWNLYVLGMIVGIVGIIMILFIIPMFLGFKD